MVKITLDLSLLILPDPAYHCKGVDMNDVEYMQIAIELGEPGTCDRAAESVGRLRHCSGQNYQKDIVTLPACSRTRK